MGFGGWRCGRARALSGRCPYPGRPGEGGARDPRQAQLVVDGGGRDDLRRRHGGHALEGLVLHGLVLQRHSTRGLGARGDTRGGAEHGGDSSRGAGETRTGLPCADEPPPNRKDVALAIRDFTSQKAFRGREWNFCMHIATPACTAVVQNNFLSKGK